MINDQNWILLTHREPALDTPVLVAVYGYSIPLILERKFEKCDINVDPYFKDYFYWNDPIDNEKEIGDNVYAWQPLPSKPDSNTITGKPPLLDVGEMMTNELISIAKKYNMTSQEFEDEMYKNAITVGAMQLDKCGPSGAMIYTVEDPSNEKDLQLTINRIDRDE